MSRSGAGPGLDRPVTLGGYSAADVSEATAVDATGPSAVQQSFADEVDINTIMRRFGVTRQLPSGIEGGVYGDFSGISDYHSAVEAIERAQAGFMALDPEIREKFGNDPGAYLDYVDSLSDEELESEVGVRAPEPVVAVVTPAPAPSPAPAAPSGEPSSGP